MVSIQADDQIGTGYLGRAYKAYVLTALTVVLTLSYLDRVLIVLLLQPIKDDLHLTDTQLGIVTGTGFALFYATLGLPIARWADRGNRVTIAAVAISLWGLTVMSCISVANFAQLLLFRIAASIGESGCMPPTYSLVGDYYPKPAERSRAMARYMLAGPLAGLVSYLAGGWLHDLYGWRMTFLLAGIPALVVAGIVKATVREPRLSLPVKEHTRSREVGLLQVLSSLWLRRSARHICLGIILLWTLGLGLQPWYAAFMVRSHGAHTNEISVWFGLIFGVGGIVGILVGGMVSARAVTRDETSQLKVNAVVVALLVPCYLLFLCLPSRVYALCALVPLVIAFNFFVGPTFALLQRLVAHESRATALAVVMLLANLIGMGAGPLAVGILSDLLVGQFGTDSLRYAMLGISVLALWAALHFWLAGRTIKADLKATAEAQN
jgi:MFS family permease